MKTGFHHIIIAVGVLILLPMAVCNGQEAAGSPSYDAYDPETDRERERVISSPGENMEPVINLSKPASTATASKDSIAVKPLQRNVKTPAEPPKNSAKPKNEDDSILSFNFLYYIIQKYKLQDIID